MRVAKALAKLSGYAGSSELKMFAYVISTNFSRIVFLYSIVLLLPLSQTGLTLARTRGIVRSRENAFTPGDKGILTTTCSFFFFLGGGGEGDRLLMIVNQNIIEVTS